MKRDGMTYNFIPGCKGNTYAKAKVQLLKQLGFYDVTEDIFKGMSDVQIDNKARSIIQGRR